MSLENLPGIFPSLIDGLLQVAESNQNPVALILGTSPSGPSESMFVVQSPSEAASLFGPQDGTLVRNMYEAIAGGAQNVRLYRMGAKGAKLTKVGALAVTNPTGGVTIEPLQKGADAGSAYKLTFVPGTLRLQIWRVSDDILVYDNNPSYPSAAIDVGELSVTGTLVAGSVAIGTAGPAGALLLKNAGSLGVLPTDQTVFTAGNDGILLSRMEMFEALFKAYKLLENEKLDLVVPANVYMDDTNVKDMTTAEVAALNTSPPWAVSSVYPTPGSFFDALGQVFAQEYQGEWYFWWDMDRDGHAEIYPSVGLANADLDAYGASLAGNWHEANFAYQLADFCYRKTEDDMAVHGFVGVNPPSSFSLKDVANWVGRAPATALDSSGRSVITASGNGSGLLGSKWMAGRISVPGTGLPGHTIDGVDGLAGGGFVATDTSWPDGSQLKDRNNHRVDIGKYISVVAGQAIMSNTTSTASYAATASATYSGFVASLPSNSAPTNKVLPGVRLPFRVSVAKLDALAGAGYVMLQQKPKGVVVSDAPTGARTDSDYRRLTTFRIVKSTIDAVRGAAEPFLGEAITGARIAALETAIEQVLVKLQKGEYLQRWEKSVRSTPQQQIQGKATVELILVPAFELRQISVVISLAAQ